jgi:DNA-3-methyladenine glycosylase II
VNRVAARIIRLDPAFAAIVEAAGPVQLRPPADDAFAALMRAIVFQQLAGRAASAIHSRVVALFDGTPPSPEALLALSEASLRSAGLSGAKQRALIDLATKFADGTVPWHDLGELDDDSVIERLTTIRGIGRWTAEMFLMFQLRRPDVWPVDDYGVRNGWARIHGLHELPAPKQLRLLGEPFRPQRTAVAWYCYRAVDMITPG